VADHEKRLIDWVLENKDLLKFSCTRYSWIDQILPGYFDFSVSMRVDGVDVLGRGVAKEETAAFGKAVCEAIERWAVKVSGAKNSNGFAAHVIPEEAKANAVSELIERDALLCHFYSGVPFESMGSAEFTNALNETELLPYLGMLQSQGIDLKSGLMATADGSIGVVAAAKGLSASPSFGLIVGCATGQNLSAALKRALISVLTNVSNVLSQVTPEALTLEAFLAQKHCGPREHFRFALHPDQGSLLDNFWQAEVLKPSNVLKQLDVKLELFELGGMLKNAPVFVCRAASSDLQDLYFGTLSAEKVNLTRLQNFACKKINVAQVLGMVHPFA
jgi:hypothetical protein